MAVGLPVGVATVPASMCMASSTVEITVRSLPLHASLCWPDPVQHPVMAWACAAGLQTGALHQCSPWLEGGLSHQHITGGTEALEWEAVPILESIITIIILAELIRVDKLGQPEV